MILVSFILFLGFLLYLGNDRLLRVLIALDIFLFAVFTLGKAKRNETISSAAWTTECDGKFMGKVSRPSIDFLFYLLTREKEHCKTSWDNETK